MLGQAHSPEMPPSGVLQPQVAHAVSQCSTATRLSIRLAGIMLESMLELAQFGASIGFAVTRRTLNVALAAAHVATAQEADKEGAARVLRRYAHLGIYMVCHAFTLAECLTMTTVDSTSRGVRFSVAAADQMVHALDAVFGSNETSQIIASFVELVSEHPEPDQRRGRSVGATRRRLGLLGAMTRAVVAYAFLQQRAGRQSQGFDEYATILIAAPAPQSICDELSTPDTASASLAATLRSSAASVCASLTRRVQREDQQQRFRLLMDLEPDPAVSFSESDSSELDDGNVPSEKLVESKNGNDSWEWRPATLSYSQDPTGRRLAKKPSLNLTLETRSRRAGPSQSGTARTSNGAPGETERSLRRQTSRLTIASSIFTTDRPSSRKPPEKRLRTDLIERYCRFSSAAYGSLFMKLLGVGSEKGAEDQPQDEKCWVDRNISAFAQHARIPRDHIASSSFHKHPSQQRRRFKGRDTLLYAPFVDHVVYWLAVDHATQSIVLALRGTLGLNDLFIDLTCAYTEFWIQEPSGHKSLAGHVHAGMLRSASLLVDADGPIFRELAKTLAQYPTYKLVVTGHSLGAGVGAMVSLLLAHEQDDGSFVLSVEAGLGPSRPLHCYAFGPPAVMSPALAKKCRRFVTSVVAQNDLVPRLSLGLVRDFQALALAAQREPLSSLFSQQLSLLMRMAIPTVLSPKSPTGALDDNAEKLVFECEKHMQNEKLVPPGLVLWLRVDTKSNVEGQSWLSGAYDWLFRPAKPAQQAQITLAAVADPKAVFGRVCFSSSMMTDHSPATYESYISQLVAQGAPAG